MAEYMNFPKRWEDFLHDYEFEDSRRIYTNGSWLIPSFRVKQMMEHYLPADVEPVRHGRCPICSGRKILTQDYYSGYSVEVDAEQGEMSIWQGDTCLTVISIDYCPNCGARMHEEVTK